MLKTCTLDYLCIDVGAGSAGQVWLDHFFWNLIEIHYRHINKWRSRLLQPDNFKSPSYTPVM